MVAPQPGSDARHLHAGVRSRVQHSGAHRRQRFDDELRALPVRRPRHLELLLGRCVGVDRRPAGRGPAPQQDLLPARGSGAGRRLRRRGAARLRTRGPRRDHGHRREPVLDVPPVPAPVRADRRVRPRVRPDRQHPQHLLPRRPLPHRHPPAAGLLHDADRLQARSDPREVPRLPGP